jgi:membrane fusion protein, heavy metal efflux system
MQTNTFKVFTFVAVVTMLSGAYIYFNPPKDRLDVTEDKISKPQAKVLFTFQQMEDAGIEIENASTGKLQKTVQGYGKITLHPDQVAHVIPKVSGIVVKAHKNMGDAVEANEVLAVLESKEMAEAKADYLAKLKKQNLQEDFLRQEMALHEKGISAEQDFLSRQQLFSMGLDESEIDSLLHTDPANLRIYEMRSPISGVVVNRELTQGELVETNHEAYVIADVSTVWAMIDIFPQDLAYVKPENEVTIQSGEAKVQSKISRLSPVIDESTRKAQAVVYLDNESGDWIPGTFITATIPAQLEEVAILVPKESLQEIDGVPCLFVPTDAGFEIRPVTKGRSDDSSVEILSGISTGEHYACKNTFIIKAEHGKDEATHAD